MDILNKISPNVHADNTIHSVIIDGLSQNTIQNEKRINMSDFHSILDKSK